MNILLKRTIALISILFFFITIMILFPQLYCCDQKIKWGQYYIYFCGKDKVIEDKNTIINTISKISKSQELLAKSNLFDKNTQVKIFFRNHIGINLPWQFSERAYGQTVPLINNIFISKVDFKNGIAFNAMNHSRPLYSVLAHEMVHVYFERKFGWVQSRLYAWFDKKAKSDLGIMWKEEGYAEYIAGGSGIGMVEGLKIIRGMKNSSYNNYEIEYFKSWLAIKYLIEKMKLGIDEILNIDVNLNTIVEQAVKEFNK